MTIFEMVLFLVVVVAIGAVIAKVYEWRQDVLYGRYIRRDDQFGSH